METYWENKTSLFLKRLQSELMCNYKSKNCKLTGNVGRSDFVHDQEGSFGEEPAAIANKQSGFINVYRSNLTFS